MIQGNGQEIIMPSANEQLLGMMNPQQARLLDQQMREQQIQQQARGAGTAEGLMAAALRTQDSIGNFGRSLLGREAPMGLNEQMAIQAQKAAKAKQAAEAQENQQKLAQKQAGIGAIAQAVNASELSSKEKAVLIQQAATGNLTAEQVFERLDKTKEASKPEQGEWKSVGGGSNTIYNSLTAETKQIPAEDISKFDKDTAALYKTYTSDSIKAHLEDNNNPLINLPKDKKVETNYVERQRIDSLVEGVKDTDINGLINKHKTLQQQSSLLESGAITGFGAPVFKTIAKIGSALGVLNPEQTNVLSNTEVYDSNAGNLVAEVIKAFGAGTGLSDKDREYATKIAGGLISVEELSLKRVLDITSRRNIAEIEAYNSKLDKLGGSWVDDKVEVPTFKRNDLSTLGTISKNGVTYYVDPEYKEVYDSNGYIIPSRGK